MQREIYTHEMLTTLQHQHDRRERRMRNLVGMAAVQRSLTRRVAHRMGGMLLQLGARLTAYGANRSDACAGADLRYS